MFDKILFSDTMRVLIEKVNMVIDKIGEPSGISILDENGKVPRENVTDGTVMIEVDGKILPDIVPVIDVPANRVVVSKNGDTYENLDVESILIEISEGMSMLYSSIMTNSEGLYSHSKEISNLSDALVAHKNSLDSFVSALDNHRDTQEIHRKITISDSDPVGGMDGDIHLKFTR